MSGSDFYTFVIVIEKQEDGEGYTAYSPTLPGCFTRAKTLEETKRKVREAIERRVDSILADGKSVRQSEQRLQVEELTLAVRRPQARSPGA